MKVLWCTAVLLRAIGGLLLVINVRVRSFAALFLTTGVLLDTTDVISPDLGIILALWARCCALLG